MQAEVIAIGDELTSGQRLDTNTQWLSQRLGEIGIPVLYHTTVGDDLDACCKVFEAAFCRAALVVATGGLGPTADDLTRQAIAAVTQRELVLDSDSLSHIESLFRIRKRAMPEQNRIQAMFPSGSQMIPNPHGTAPGIDLSHPVENGFTRVFALPGVPAEMREMWEKTVLPRLQQIPGIRKKTILHYRLKCFGVGESACEELMPDLIQRGRSPSVGITVHRGTITLRVTAEGESESSCREKMKSTISAIHQSLGNLVFGEEDDELQDAIIRLLRHHQKTVSVCEWGTGGLVQDCLGRCDSAGVHFRGGMTMNSLENLTRALEVDKKMAADPCSKFLAEEMAGKIRQHLNTDFGLAITAFPDTSSGKFAVAVASNDTSNSKARPYASHPDIKRDLAAKTALNLLRITLL